MARQNTFSLESHMKILRSQMMRLNAISKIEIHFFVLCCRHRRIGSASFLRIEYVSIYMCIINIAGSPSNIDVTIVQFNQK